DTISCNDQLQLAIEQTEMLCEETGRHEACYGNSRVDWEANPGFESAHFTEPGDLIEVTALRSLRLSPLEEDVWGIVEMHLQANLPDEETQTIKLILFGDVELENNAEDTQWRPMQAFYFQSHSTPACEGVPTSGLVIQTPEGVGEVSFLIN